VQADLAIIGAGPTGLAAAIYAAREGIKTEVLEKDVVVGGLAAITAQIENYPGFPEGISGMELADKLEAQARKFGAQILTAVNITKLSATGEGVALVTDQGTRHYRATLITTGNHYRKLDVPGEAQYSGKGVHYCATCDGPLYKDKPVVVVGGGNSAMQEGLFLARLASRVTMLVRGPALKGTADLIKRVQAESKIEVHYQAAVSEIVGNGQHVTAVKADREYAAEAVFIFIGLIPNTQWLQATLELDRSGSIITDANYQTNQASVFAAGDVRAGSTYQIASAVAEGVEAALSVSRFLHN
jgi:thioredoxin reductase (NADPH)